LKQQSGNLDAEHEKTIHALSCLKESDRLTAMKDILSENYEQYQALSLEEKANVDDQLKLIMTPEEYTLFVDESRGAAGSAWAARALRAAAVRSPIAGGPEIFAAACKDRAQLHCYIEGFFKRNAAAFDVSFVPIVPKAFDVSPDGSCITDVRATDITMIKLTALQCVYMKGQDKEQEANPGTGVTFAASLGFMMKVLELEIQNYSQSELQPIFKEIKSYFNIDVNFELQQAPASYAGSRDYDGLNGCILANIMAVLEKLAVIVKNIKLSMYVDGGALATVEQRAIFNHTMSLHQYAICVRVCAQNPDEDICGDMPKPDDEEFEERLTMKLLVNVIDVYTPLLVQDIKASYDEVEQKSSRGSEEPSAFAGTALAEGCRGEGRQGRNGGCCARRS
jgi:hypothetical protein